MVAQNIQYKTWTTIPKPKVSPNTRVRGQWSTNHEPPCPVHLKIGDF